MSNSSEKTFCLVYSNYTCNLFAWEGTAKENKQYLGNREVLGEVTAPDAEAALAKWQMIQHGTTSAEVRA